jgi:hypothetical protein
MNTFVDTTLLAQTALTTFKAPCRIAPSIIRNTVNELTGYGRIFRDEDLESLTAVATTVQKMVNGTAGPMLYLATQPTGWGKTSVVAASVKAIVNEPACADVGVLVLVNQLEQIPILVKRMGLRKDQFDVRTGKENEELNSMGRTSLFSKQKDRNQSHHDAQVLFTTQQKLRAMMAHQKDFEAMKFFEYRGRLRAVRLWDEAYVPIDPVTITTIEVAGFAERLASAGEQQAAAKIREWLASMAATLPEYSQVPTWAFHVQLNTDFDALMEALSEGGDEQAMIAEAMCWLDGKEVRVERQDYRHQTVTIAYRRSIPYNIEPLLIFDAGGKEAAHYRLMARNRGGIIKLPSVTKTYKNLTVRFWDRATGHAEYRKKKSIEEFADVVAQAICEKPRSEEVLIVHRRGVKAPATTLPALIRAKVAKLNGDPERLHFLQHYATNRHQHTKHVILVGVHQAPLTSIKALVYGATGKPMRARVSKRDVELMRMSRIMGDTNQAVGRGAVRHMIDGDVPIGCTLDLIASSWGPLGFRDPFGTLAEMFPGATIKPWYPTAKAKEENSLLAFVDAARIVLDDQQEVIVTLRELATIAGYSERTLQRALNSGELIALLAEHGLTARLKSGRWTLGRCQTRSAPGKGDRLHKEP